MTTQQEAFEAIDSGRVRLTASDGNDALSLKWFVTGTDNYSVAKQLAVEAIQNVLMVDERVVVVDSLELESIGPELWQATFEYVSPEFSYPSGTPKTIGESTFDFDTTGGSARILAAYNQTNYGPSATKFANAINVRGGAVDGVDIVTPKLAFTVHQRFAGDSITLQWLRAVVNLTGTTNLAPFLGFAAGEVLFLGASGQQPTQFYDNGQVVKGERDVSFSFVVSPNLSGLQFGTINQVSKKGHQYIWWEYRDRKVAAQGETPAKILTDLVGVHVATVYRETDFGLLSIVNPFTSAPVMGA
jgi:hypothetical protein